MIHPHTEVRFISQEKGYGVVATKFIPKGTITWALDKLDRVFSPAEIDQLDDLHKNILDIYTFRDHDGNYILCWDHGRYVNHSFKSNCLTTAYNFELAIRDIEPGEELTDDYGYLNISEPFEALPEKGIKRTTVYPDDLLRFHKKWDKKLQEAFTEFDKVDQPLMNLLDADTQGKSRLIAAGKAKMDSILSCYYRGEKPESANGSVEKASAN